MNRTLVRRLTVAAAAIVALLVLAGAIFTATFDVNRYKPQIVGAVKERTGRTLRFDGDLGLSLFPRIAVKLPRRRCRNRAATRCSRACSRHRPPSRWGRCCAGRSRSTACASRA